MVPGKNLELRHRLFIEVVDALGTMLLVLFSKLSFGFKVTLPIQGHLVPAISAKCVYQFSREPQRVLRGTDLRV